MVALAAAGALSVAAVAPAATTARYEGKTKAGGPVSFRLSNGSVKRFQASVSVVCVSAAPARTASEVYVVAPDRSAKLGRKHQFTIMVRKPKQQFQDETGKVIQTLYSVKATVEGKVPARSAAGTVKVSYNKYWNAYDPATGSFKLTIAACFGGRTSWTAKQK